MLRRSEDPSNVAVTDNPFRGLDFFETESGDLEVEKPVVGTVTDTLNVPKVEVGTDTAQVTVPNVDIRKDTANIKVPTVKVKR